jgi:hypothetical protein
MTGWSLDDAQHEGVDEETEVTEKLVQHQIPIREAVYEASQQALIAQTRVLGSEQWAMVGRALETLARTDRSPSMEASRGLVLIQLASGTGPTLEDQAIDMIVDVLWAIERAGGNPTEVAVDATAFFREEKRRAAPMTGPITQPNQVAHVEPPTVPTGLEPEDDGIDDTAQVDPAAIPPLPGQVRQRGK